MFRKAITRILLVGLSMLALSVVVARPALAAIKFGSYQLSQLALSHKMLESAALLLFGIGFIALASAVRKLQASAE